MKEQPGNVLRAHRDGHVVIPSDVVSQLGVGSGEGLHWAIEDGRLVLMPRIKLVKKLIGLFGAPKQPTVQPGEKAAGAETVNGVSSANPPELERKPPTAGGAS